MFPCCWPSAEGHCACGRKHQGRDVGKVPLTKHGLVDATTRESTIQSWWRRWPNANIGLVTGTASSIVVLDVDVDREGDVLLAALEGQFGELPATPESLTGGGGRHVLFAHPGQPIRNAVSVGGLDGLDIRADGGYIVAPPSLHQSGRCYEWDASRHPDDVKLSPLPDWLLSLLVAPPGGNGSKPTSVIGETIQFGQRNATLASLAGAMRRRGMTRTAILAALLTTNAEQCVPPLAETEVEKIATSVANYKPMPKSPPAPTLQAAAQSQGWNLTDTGNAERLVARYGENLHYCYAWGRWLVWDGKRWKCDEGGEVDRLAKATVRSIYAEAAKEPDDTRRKALADHAKRSEHSSRRRATVELAQSEPRVPIVPDRLDVDPWLFNVHNGTIELRTGILRPHSQADLLTKMAGSLYDAQAQCPIWLAFLNRIMADNQNLIAFLQRAVGYALTGDTSEQCLFMFYGLGSNGKTTFLQILRDLLGDYGQQADFATFLHKDYQAVPSDIARMMGARLVAAVEAGEGRRLAEVVIKQLTGQDTITARFLFHDYFEFRPQFKLFLAMNHKPNIRETTNAMWRRVRLVPFTVGIPEAEQDKGLPAKLKVELPGILRWAVNGCLEWQRSGLGVPDEVRQATDNYRDEMDVIGGFLSECCTLQSAARTAAKELYETYKLWAMDNNEHTITQTAFGIRLTDRGLLMVRGSKGRRMWQGIGLTEAGIQSEMLDGAGDAVGDALTRCDAFPQSTTRADFTSKRVPENASKRVTHPNASPTNGPQSSASVPLLITFAMREELTGMGFSQTDIDGMTPTEAHSYLQMRAEIEENGGKQA